MSKTSGHNNALLSNFDPIQALQWPHGTTYLGLHSITEELAQFCTHKLKRSCPCQHGMPFGNICYQIHKILGKEPHTGGNSKDYESRYERLVDLPNQEEAHE